jgi:hybrid cluster-associated redox disulfide protein
MTERLTASTTVADALLKRPLAARLLVHHRMHCVGCAVAPFETLAEACEIYRVAVQDLLAELNASRMDSAGEDILAKSDDPR